jgi:hypothetical protein
MLRPDPTSGCSKAPRGLFVLSRVDGIFTVSSISPGPSLRQCPDRYAIRAGRNLPDKEFRYLRTVIVTAAIDRGFGSKLSPLPLTFRHRAGVSPYTSAHALAGTCVFVKQSPGPAHCGPPELLHPRGRPFSRSYGANLPSSLTRGLPSTLGYLPPPTCVGLRYGRLQLPQQGFSWPRGSTGSPWLIAAAAPLLGHPCGRPASLEAASPTPPPAYPTASPRWDFVICKR